MICIPFDPMKVLVEPVSPNERINFPPVTTSIYGRKALLFVGLESDGGPRFGLLLPTFILIYFANISNSLEWLMN